jgi:hypothetical protein
MLSAISFWIFVTVIVVASLCYSYARKHDVQKTLRLAIEKGMQLDPTVVDSLVTKKPPPQSEGYLIGGICTLAVGIGLPILGYFVGRIEQQAFFPIVGAGILVGLIGLGLTGSALLLRRSEKMAKNRSSACDSQ